MERTCLNQLKPVKKQDKNEFTSAILGEDWGTREERPFFPAAGRLKNSWPSHLFAERGKKVFKRQASKNTKKLNNQVPKKCFSGKGKEKVERWGKNAQTTSIKKWKES